jgi:hypothetical protein
MIEWARERARSVPPARRPTVTMLTGHAGYVGPACRRAWAPVLSIMTAVDRYVGRRWSRSIIALAVDTAGYRRGHENPR